MPSLRALRILAVLCAVLGVYGGLHAYVADRLFVAPRWPVPVQVLGIGAMVLLALGVPLRLIGQRRSSSAWVRALALPAYLWLGFGLLLLVSVAVSDVAFALAGKLAVAAVAPDGGAASQIALVEARLQAVLAGFFGLCTGMYAWLHARGGPQLARHAVRIERWPSELDGFRIVQISDVHIGSQLRAPFARRVAEQVNALQPDLIAITGDLVDGRVEDLHAEVAPFSQLRAEHGVYFVTGNHDHYSGADGWSGHLSQLGIRVLRNEHVVLGRGAARFVLAGVDDHRGGRDGSTADLQRALAGRDCALPLLLLAHDPNSFAQASRSGVHLQLSGHTHGGQIWPFRYLVRLATPWLAGLYREGDAQLYVSRGTGFWGPPMRLGAPAEISEITLSGR